MSSIIYDIAKKRSWCTLGTGSPFGVLFGLGPVPGKDGNAGWVVDVNAGWVVDVNAVWIVVNAGWAVDMNAGCRRRRGR